MVRRDYHGYVWVTGEEASGALWDGRLVITDTTPLLRSIAPDVDYGQNLQRQQPEGSTLIGTALMPMSVLAVTQADDCEYITDGRVLVEGAMGISLIRQDRQCLEL